MVERTIQEEEPIAEFLGRYFPEAFDPESESSSGEAISEAERDVIESLLGDVERHFSTSKGTLGLALDFLMVAEQLSHSDERLADFEPEIDRAEIFDRYDRKPTKATLTIKYGGGSAGIRPVQNEVIDLFREDLGRTNFPSSPGHHTGEWERYDHMLEKSFKLSRQGRYEAAQQLFDFGLAELDGQTPVRREPPFPAPFLKVVENYHRKAPEEQGGSAYQALAYGYVKTKWSHLSLRASKVRTGSSRQNRYGDIDGFMGPDLMVSVEVKDRVIDGSNVKSELGTMMDLAEKSTAIAIAICKEVSDQAKETLADADVEVITDEDLEEELRTWDYHKQNRALQGMIHFFAHIEENPAGTQRLLSFIADVDPDNPALVHLQEDSTG